MHTSSSIFLWLRTAPTSAAIHGTSSESLQRATSKRLLTTQSSAPSSLLHLIWERCLLQAAAAGGRYVGMDDVDAGVEEHKEAGAMSKWWTGVKSSKMATAVGNNRAVQALTYVSLPPIHSADSGCGRMLDCATAKPAFMPLYLWVAHFCKECSSPQQVMLSLRIQMKQEQDHPAL